MTEVHMRNVHHQKFLQFVDSGTHTGVHVNPTHFFADSMSFQILPAGKEQDKVRIHCSDGNHAGKYLLVNSNNEVVAETAADEDTSTHFLRQNIGGSSTLLTIILSPVNVPTHYVAFHADSGKAQLEKELTDRSKLELMNTQFRDQKQGVTTEGLGDVIELPGGN